MLSVKRSGLLAMFAGGAMAVLAVAGNWADLVGASAPAPAPVTPKNEAEMPKDGVVAPKPPPIAVAPIRLTRLSFGAAEGYRVTYGGLPVDSDGPEGPLEIAGFTVGGTQKYAVGAYVRGIPEPRPAVRTPVRLDFVGDAGKSFLVGAWRKNGANVTFDPRFRVLDERTVTFPLPDGQTGLDFTQSTWPSLRAGLREETWVITARANREVPLEAATVLAEVPVRIYTTLPRRPEFAPDRNDRCETVYYVACKYVRARTANRVERQIFEKFGEREVFNAAGNQLTYAKKTQRDWQS